MYQYDLAIVGGGPAGLAAAATAMNAHLNFALISPDMGGKINYGFSLPNMTDDGPVWGSELVRQIEAQVQTKPDCHIKQKATAIERIENGFALRLVGAQEVEQTLRAKVVIVTTGAAPRRLYIPGEKEFWGRGLSYSTVSHAKYMKGKKVAVIGSGRRALISALRLGAIADHVYLIPTTLLPEGDSRIEQMNKDPKISLLFGWEPQHFLGGEFLEGVAIIQEDIERALAVDAAFVELGLLPDQNFLGNLVEFDAETGKIPINQLCETAVPGLYAAGDVTNTFAEQVPVAIGEGIKAALSAWEYLVTKM